jgi:phosphocarrier protein HPr
VTVSVRATVCNQRGLHARAAARFCEAAGSFDSRITVVKDGMKVGGCSLMALLMLGAAKGTTLTIEAEGPDEQNAANILLALVEGGFGEGC